MFARRDYEGFHYGVITISILNVFLLWTAHREMITTPIHKNEAIEAILLQIYIICVHFFSVLVYFVVFWCNTLSLGNGN